MADSPSGGWREVYREMHCPLPTDDPDDQPGEASQDDDEPLLQTKLEAELAKPSSENYG